MIKAILIDDEIYIREIVKEKLTANFKDKIEIIGEAGTVKDAVTIIKELKPDLLFLDIHLKDGTSFDILSQIDHKNLSIVFITGFDDHAIKAIKVGALDYIIKPIDTTEFNEAVLKVIESYKVDNFTEKSVEVSKEHFTNTSAKKRIILKTLENIFIVYEDDIFYCKSEGNYTTFYTQKNDRIVVSKPIKMMEELLSKDIFIRCHKSYLINKKHVIQYNKNGHLIINETHKVPVSSRRKDFIIQEIFK
ncbi:LytR/AlgR family response regulator transcription factor [Tenacibaculum jejuense]|uniref:Two-component system response regulatory protein, LytTR family n=1 Tax=Tenacibaculum jejuense TaxID=584609 RepID=A0A238U8M6_9FLAO|nr:LytTR family DNA-binding domain-containing protein [Tenacibaculum jejuense]SNR15553.1 Two-component system response regulatory protein, LytTR family [Tenacibaculum jejuense]